VQAHGQAAVEGFDLAAERFAGQTAPAAVVVQAHERAVVKVVDLAGAARFAGRSAGQAPL